MANKLLVRRAFFYSVILVLFFISGLNLYLFRHDFASLSSHLFTVKQDSQTDEWQKWGTHYVRLFAMLKTGEKIGILLDGSRSTGFLFVRDSRGVQVRRTMAMQKEMPGVVVSMDSQTAQKFLSSVERTNPDQIWALMKDALYGREITVWADPNVQRLQAGGYLKFLRAIDTRPPNMDWPALKKIIGEKS